jgi:hypothetical protein
MIADSGERPHVSCSPITTLDAKGEPLIPSMTFGAVTLLPLHPRQRPIHPIQRKDPAMALKRFNPRYCLAPKGDPHMCGWSATAALFNNDRRR